MMSLLRMPNQAPLIDALRGNTFLSSVDLASGYWKVPVAAEHRHKTAFVTPDGGCMSMSECHLAFPMRPQHSNDL